MVTYKELIDKAVKYVEESEEVEELFSSDVFYALDEFFDELNDDDFVEIMRFGDTPKKREIEENAINIFMNNVVLRLKEKGIKVYEDDKAYEDFNDRDY